jgi:hypothetical protein
MPRPDVFTRRGGASFVFWNTLYVTSTGSNVIPTDVILDQGEQLWSGEG